MLACSVNLNKFRSDLECSPVKLNIVLHNSTDRTLNHYNIN